MTSHSQSTPAILFANLRWAAKQLVALAVVSIVGAIFLAFLLCSMAAVGLI